MSRIHKSLNEFLIAWYLKANHISFVSIPKMDGRWPKFNNQGRILLGHKCRFREYRTRHIISVIDSKALLEFGDYCFIGDGANICASRKIIIGAHTRLAPNVAIYDTNFHPIQEGDEVFQADVIIGRNVWIGQNSVILPGVTIGDHTVIGANSVITKDIPSKVVAAGSPAGVVKNIECDDDWIRT